MKFKGSLEELKSAIDAISFLGDWTAESGGKFCFRSKTGAVLNWWSSTGTITCQGDKDDSQRLDSLLESQLNGGNPMPKPNVTLKSRIFVVHGHDTTAREQLELVLHRLGLEPFILMNSSGGTKTIIEALEQHIGKNAESDVGIVLVTPDDMGYSKRDGEKEVKARARQNVILEMGMLFASLTRQRCVLLVKGYVELPSDAQGVIYIPFNDHVKETVPKLSERLQQNGITITAEQISKASM